jgi:hypothetical protein
LSEKTVAEKFRIKPGTTVWCSPAEHQKRIGPLPEGVGAADGPATATTAIVFADDEASLRRALADHGADLAEPDMVWIAYPKGGASDLNRDKLPPILGEVSMRPIGQIAVDETWSALRFRPLKPGEEPFEGGRR